MLHASICEMKKLLEASVRGTFDLATFKSFDDQFDAYNYARDNLKALGKGSGRVAYAYSSGKALKIAMNEQGFRQNEVEVSVYSQPKTRDIVAKIYEHDPGMMWVLVELVRPINSEEEFMDYVSAEGFSGTVADAPDIYGMNAVVGDIVDNEYEGALAGRVDPVFAYMLRTVVVENDLEVSDIVTKRSWGKTSDGRLVLLDYGFDRANARTHYT